MPNENATEAQPLIAQPLSIETGHAPLRQDNTHYPKMREADLVDINCSICRNSFEKGDTAAKLKECEHIFHENCMLRYLGVPDAYLDPSEPYRTLWYKLTHLAEPSACSGIFSCYYPPWSSRRNPRNVKLSDSDISLLHQPDHPQFLAGHLYKMNHYGNQYKYRYYQSEWFDYQGRRPDCPNCRQPFNVVGSYTLYQITNTPDTAFG
ncbi:RING-H2 finger protein [Candidatus Sororendozoicomonas aggregata]|uniref:RING finger protein n=1 Tax=Candidatus Sororendozoicomonas aggregata TaxID=3073239 RepID=UPI002ED0FE17